MLGQAAVKALGQAAVKAPGQAAVKALGQADVLLLLTNGVVEKLFIVWSFKHGLVCST